jgi:hypothetical protein
MTNGKLANDQWQIMPKWQMKDGKPFVGALVTAH